jgi:diguanylate cyclase (GGDEF)-like protein
MHGGGWVATFEDITEERKTQLQIAHMARHDALTELPNRMHFRFALDEALLCLDPGEQLAVLCLDLDQFKPVNDSLGHAVGDDLLRAVARRLEECCHGIGLVARLGGDEFAVVQARASQASAAQLAQAIVGTLGAPFTVGGHQVVIGVSVGVALAPDDAHDADRLVRHADLALYRAKDHGRGTFRFFEPGMDARAQARRLLEVDLRTALPRGELALHYQPIHDTAAARITCLEALVRWEHPLRGPISPSSFMPIAEETGLIVPLGAWVLGKACADATTWPADVRVAVNLSLAQFNDRGLVEQVEGALAASQLPPERLELEITEAVLLQSTEATLDKLHALRRLGVRISMDDFGTGYSSLSYLRSFQFDKIKIDRSFVHDLPKRGENMAIVRAVTELGRSLGISTTAEGVETDEQLALLRAGGCTEVQGFLLSSPRPAHEIAGLLWPASRASGPRQLA